MDIIDKIFSKLSRQSAPDDLKASVLAEARKPIKRWNFSLQKLAPVLGVLVLVVGIAIYYKYYRLADYASAFELTAQESDIAGIGPNSSFILKSTVSLSTYQVGKVVKFDPEIEFDVESIGENTFRITPKGNLDENKIYQIQIEEGVADREYSWAYQVKAPFNIIKTSPGNKTSAPVNSGIELTFNRTDVKNIEKYFEITPNVPGRFEVSEDTAVFIPKNPLAEHTIYTVSVKKGLGASGTSDTLNEDYQFAFETQTTNSPEYNYISFTDDFVTSPAGINPDLGVYSYNFSGSLSASIYKISSPDEFIGTYQNSRNWSWGWASFYRQNGQNRFETKDKKALMTFQPGIATHNYQSYIEIPQTLDPGMYVIDLAYSNDKHDQAWLQVTNTAHYFSLTQDKGFLWLYDFAGKSPIPNAKVEFSKSGQSTQGLGQSNADGLLEFNTPDGVKSSDNYDNPPFLKITNAQGQISFAKLQDRWGYSGNFVVGGDNYWKFLSTDRYTYQMTDTIHFWGVVKSRNEDVRQKKVKVSLMDNSGYWYYYSPTTQRQPLASTEVMVSPFNTIEGSFSFAGLDPNSYNLVVTFGDETVTQTSVEVLTYSKPTYQINVTTSKPAIYAGDSVTFTASATFFDGTPLANAKLAYSGYWDKNITGTVTLDKNGVGTVTLNPAYIAKAYYPRDLSLYFHPATAEEGEIEGTGSVLVFGPHMLLQSEQTHQTGDNYTFRAKLNDINIENKVPEGNGFRMEYIAGPVANYPIQAEIKKITYNKVESGSYYDPINKVVNKTYNYERHEEIIETINGTTNGNGEYEFSRNLLKGESTYYEVTFRAVDRAGRKIDETSYAYYATYDSWNPARLSLNIGNGSYQNEFSVGEQVSLVAAGQGGLDITNKPILFYRYQNNIDRVVVSRSAAFAENFGKDFIPSVQYRAVVWGPYGFAESNTVMALYKQNDSNIKIDISPDKASYRPGDKVNLKFHISDKDGKGLVSETNVAVVDEAVFHVLPYSWQQELLSSLYVPIYTSPTTGTTSYLIPTADDFASNGGGAEKGGCFTAGTQILMASGKTKGIEELRVGDQILTFSDPLKRKLTSATVQGISSHEVDEFLVIDNKLQVTGEHTIYLNGKWDFAGNAKVGDTLVLKDAATEIINDISTKHVPHTKVFNIVVGKYHTYFADGYFVHNAEKGGTPRSNFVDTAVFETVHTDNAGNAKLEFTAPDNITSWRVTARSFDTEGLKAGEETKLIPATLPLFINGVLSNTYLAGDSPQVKIGIYGSSYNPDQPVSVNVSSKELKLNQNVTIKDHLGYAAINNLPEGEYDIVISAQQGNLKDSLSRHIKVVKSYFAKPTTSTQDVKTGNQTITGNQNGYTKLEFVDAGKAKYYDELLWASYSGGIRSDQEAASFVSAAMLKQYFHDDHGTVDLDLSSYVDSAGGIRVLTYSDADLELSAKMADIAPDHVFGSRLERYFNNATKDKKSDLHRQALALYGLASLHKPVLSRLQNLESDKNLTWQDKIYVAMGLAKLGANEQARMLYYKDIRSHLHFDGPQAWYEEVKDTTARVKLTDMTGVLASVVSAKDDSP
ncbi:MAG: Ig-like domain-containing protein, partial [Candidatus Doudnabacteria bacterium]|nr:Ig-like domain-containing protein [Candidatus Doudnabacteria bacterium]